LFTYKKYKQLGVHNTTNSLDGGVFSPMKMLIKIGEIKVEVDMGL